MSDIPQSLRECNQWLCWRVETREEETKVPINPHTGSYASTKDNDTWTSYQEAKEAHQSSAIQTDGIGFVFTSDDPFVGIDLDETPIGKATEIIEKLQSYTEQSPSGITGDIGNFHVICKGYGRLTHLGMKLHEFGISL
jgi:putative DNA primase/helicase